MVVARKVRRFIPKPCPTAPKLETQNSPTLRARRRGGGFERVFHRPSGAVALTRGVRWLTPPANIRRPSAAECGTNHKCGSTRTRFTRLRGYAVTRLRGYAVTRLRGYAVTRLRGYAVQAATSLIEMNDSHRYSTVTSCSLGLAVNTSPLNLYSCGLLLE
jgi:hypothetical protein